MKIVERIIKPLVAKKAEVISELCLPHLKGKILDIGAGRAFIAKRIQEKSGNEVIALDIDDLNETDLQYTLFDGKHIPFDDHAFGTALLIYVLHHCTNQEEVLREAMRVSKRIIIFEDLGPYPLTQIADFFVNTILHGVRAPFTFRRDHEWKTLFTTLGLTLIEEQQNVEKSWYYPIKHVMYVVES